MTMLEKRWFQTLVATVLIFVLILLISKTGFIFEPVMKYVGAVAVPIIGAGILFYLTKPVMHFFESFKINRIVSILLVFLLITVIMTLFILYIFPIAQRQFENLVANIPKMVQSTQDFIVILQSYDLVIPDQIDEAIESFMSNIQTHIENVMSYLFGFIANLITIIASLFLIPFFLFFMLKDGDKLVPFITQVFEKKKADNIRNLLGKIDDTLTAFIQGQLIVSFFLGILLLIAYLIIGLNYALTLALFGMIMNVIPFIGPFLAVIPALIVGAFQDPMMIVWVSIVTLIAQQIESNFISPNVMGRVLALHPLTVITVILAAGSIAGFLGILFAVPTYAVIKTIYIHFYHLYRDKQTKKHSSEPIS
ncbi:MAG TPA: AI-2E family transporter [Virgibacillus sp.]|nr:AI-2E family transporter [Virgibacillus sp.]